MEYLFQTERCGIRPFQERDLDLFMAYRNDLDWMRYQGFKGRTREEYAQALLFPPDLEKGAQLALTDREDRLVGDLYVREEDGRVEIGFTLSPYYTGRGYALEAVRGLVEYLRKTSAKPIVAETAPENTPSIRLLRKLGFREEGLWEGWLRFVHGG